MALDLQSAVTHELGHVLGFDHVCDALPGKSGLRCSEASKAVRRSVMFPGATLMLTDDLSLSIRRRLTQDDIRAICEVYPSPRNPSTTLRSATN